MKSRKRKPSVHSTKGQRKAAPRRTAQWAGTGAGQTVPLLGERLSHPETSPVLTGGDPDADWQGALSTGEEAVGGSVSTPDQDVVDELGRALGVEQLSDAEVRSSDEILRTRDRHYWHLERRAAEKED